MNKSTLLLKIVYSSVFLLIAQTAIPQNQIAVAEQKISGWQATAGLSNAGICVAVSDSKTGEFLIKSAPQLSLLPASIMKVVTTATALEVFGPDFRFKTTLSYSGIIRNDTLFGDLQLIGGGDPTLGSLYFPEYNHFLDDWIKAIESKNIRAITGKLILDASIYESQTIPNSWVWEDIGNYYGAGASGISVFDNLYEIHLNSPDTADKPTQIIQINPKVPNLDLHNEVLSSDSNSDQAYVFGSPEENKRVIRGTIPKGKSDFVVQASVPDPAALLASEFRKKLAANSISLSGKNTFEKIKIPQDQQMILSVFQSPALIDIIRVTNHESINLFAEHLLKHMAWQKYGLGTTKDGCNFVVQFWKDKGLDLTGFFMNDGSGLSRFNALSASQMVAILNHMKTKSAWSAEFTESLATAGKGTLTVFTAEKFPDNCLHAKSGSMTRVRCYAGYLISNSGRELSFTFMLNNFSCSQSEAIKKIGEVLVELRKL
jgi:serine-type D-Ala-D-Ala carboxypeptidase/endopeptidase (penicillin-binding protein 4)